MKDTIRTVAATAPMSSVSTINRVNLSGASAGTVSTAPHQIMHGTVVVDGLKLVLAHRPNNPTGTLTQSIP